MLSNNKIIYQSIHLAVPHESLCIFLSLEVYLPWVRMKLKKPMAQCLLIWRVCVLTFAKTMCSHLFDSLHSKRENNTTALSGT